MSTHTALIAYARPRDGVFTTSEASARGVTRRELQGLHRRGEIVRVHRGVYRFTHVPVTPMALLRAALAAVRGDAVASHSSAAMLLGLDGVPVGTPEISVVERSGDVPRLHRVRVHTSRERALNRLHVDPRGRLHHRVADADRSLPSRSRGRQRAPCGSGHLCWHSGTSDPARAGDRTVARSAGRVEAGRDHRTGRRRRLLVRAGACFGTNLRRHGLPIPEFNTPIEIAGRRYYADALWRARGLVAELHGIAFHRSPAHRARDDERMNAALGLTRAAVAASGRQ